MAFRDLLIGVFGEELRGVSQMSEQIGAVASSALPDGVEDCAAFPAPSAGATFQHAIASGKFHGTMQAITPSGCRSVKSNPMLAEAAFADGCRETSPVPVTREDLQKLYARAF